jgi:hypothetical protein
MPPMLWAAAFALAPLVAALAAASRTLGDLWKPLL